MSPVTQELDTAVNKAETKLAPLPSQVEKGSISKRVPAATIIKKPNAINLICESRLFFIAPPDFLIFSILYNKFILNSIKK
jgi:hypothetical protein